MQVPDTASSFTANSSTPASSSAAGSGTAQSFQSLLGQLNNYSKETPAQRMENAILAQLGITPQQLQNMSPAQRAKVESEVKDLMKKEIQAQQQQQAQQAQAQTQQPASAQSQTQSQSQSQSKHYTKIDFSV
jgi:hypothetical protein